MSTLVQGFFYSVQCKSFETLPKKMAIKCGLLFFLLCRRFRNLVGKMSVKPIIPSINSNNNNANNLKMRSSSRMSMPQNQMQNRANSNTVSFQGGVNPIVGFMDFIDAGGYAASFIIQDGLGFIAPRVGKGLVRGAHDKKDENGNVVLGKDGKPQRELNWALARKEFLREIITGPSAFLIPLGMLHVIKKNFGRGNNVKLNYIDGFQKPFTDFATKYSDEIASGNADKGKFYKRIFKDTIERSVNGSLPDAEKMSAEEVAKYAESFTEKQIKIEDIMADKSLSKTQRKAKLAEVGSIVDDFMKLKKGKIGGAVDEMAVQFSASNGKMKHGTIGELVNAMSDYFDDAVKTAHKAIKDKASVEELEKVIKSYTNRKMGSRILTNLGIFGTVAAFYTQIPKLYNMGQKKGNPVTAGTEQKDTVTQQPGNGASADKTQAKANEGKNGVAFTGLSGFLEKTGDMVFHSSKAKKVSDIFELNGPVMSANAMTTLLFGFCIPPRLSNANDKYEYGEVVVRDMTAFTALLFGAKALARLCSDGFTKITGLALNKKNMEGHNGFHKVIDYLNPNDTHHSVLSTKQLISKYTNIEDYKGGVNGFMDFIEASGGDVKKAMNCDKNIRGAVEEILKKFNSKTFADATSKEIKAALKSAHAENGDLIKKFYKLFDANNGLLNKARTCNSTFGFVSTILLIPGLIIALGEFCERMTDKRSKKDLAAAEKAGNTKKANEAEKYLERRFQTNAPSMAGFLGNGIR